MSPEEGQRPAYRMILYRRESGWQRRIFNALAEYLCQRGLAVVEGAAETFALEGSRIEVALHHALAILQEVASGRFYALDLHDWPDPWDIEFRALALDRRCRVYLKGQYRADKYDGRLRAKIKPWTYFEGDPDGMRPHLERLRQVPRQRPGLYFRGALYLEERTAVINRLKERGLMNDDCRVIAFDEYLAEASEYRLMLGLSGMGDLCRREIEALAIGTPVLRPRLKNRLHHDLEADYHYVSVDVDSDEESPEVIAAAVERRYREVIDDEAYLAFVAGNACRWYDANARFPDSLALTARLLGLPGDGEGGQTR